MIRVIGKSMPGGRKGVISDSFSSAEHGCSVETLGEAARGFAVAPAGHSPPECEDLPILADSGGEFAAAFSARPGMAWLVRPDSYIGWCSAAPSVAGLRSFLETITRKP